MVSPVSRVSIVLLDLQHLGCALLASLESKIVLSVRLMDVKIVPPLLIVEVLVFNHPLALVMLDTSVAPVKRQQLLPLEFAKKVSNVHKELQLKFLVTRQQLITKMN
jgi:hypothetical protein